MTLKQVGHIRSDRSHRLRFSARLSVSLLVLVALVVSMASLALAAPDFPDVPSSHQYYVAITDLASRGVIGGYEDGSFGPSNPVTRQQFAKMIVLTGRYEVSEDDACPFVDVDKGDDTTLYPDNFVAVCAAHGITTGKTATTFDPTGKITRYQVVTMVVRLADDIQPGLLATPPAGWVGDVTWANNATHGANAARAEFNGILTGLDFAALSPMGDMNRGEVAQVLHNLLEKISAATTTTTTAQPVSTTTTTAAQPETTTTTQTGGPSVLRFAVGEEQAITLKMSDVKGQPLSGLSVEWFMEGVGFFVPDNAADVSDPDVAANNKDLDVTDAKGQAVVRVKSDVPGTQIVKVKVRYNNGYTTMTYATIEWY